MPKATANLANKELDTSRDERLSRDYKRPVHIAGFYRLHRPIGEATDKIAEVCRIDCVFSIRGSISYKFMYQKHCSVCMDSLCGTQRTSRCCQELITYAAQRWFFVQAMPHQGGK